MMPWAPSDQPGKTTHPWVFTTKGTGEPPGKPVPSFYPFRHNASSMADASGGAVAGGRRWRCFTPFEPPPAPCFDPGGRPPSARFLPSRAEDGGVPPFSSVAPGRRRRGFSKLPTLCRRLVIPAADTQSPWDAEALVLECQPRASQLNTAPSLIVRRGGIPGLLPVPDILEGCTCCPPEPFPRHRWLRASQSSRMAWPVAGDSNRREIRR